MTYLVKYRNPGTAPTLFDDFDKIFSSFFPIVSRSGNYGDWSVNSDLVEDKDSLIVNLEAPGLEKRDLSVVLNDGILTISGNKKVAEEFKDKNIYRSERTYGEFKRCFALPKEVQADKIEASYIDGILTVRLPKAEEEKSKVVSVEVK